MSETKFLGAEAILVYRKHTFRRLLETYLPESVISKALSQYALNDAAHLEDHAIAVVIHADEIIKRFPELQQWRGVILVAALLHDTKCHVNRDKHHILGALAVYREFLCSSPVSRNAFTYDEVTMIEECVLEHRASWKHKRSHSASEAVAAADRGKPDLYGYMRRAVRFRYAQLEQGTVVTEETKRTIITDSITHMREKFGVSGYAWDSMPKYTLLMYEAEIEEMKSAVSYPNSHLVTVALERFDEWVS